MLVFVGLKRSILTGICAANLLACGSSAAKKETITIGGMLATSNNEDQELGLAQAAAIRLAVNDINAAGGVLGKNFDVDIRDFQDNDDLLDKEVKSLVLDKKYGIIVGTGGTGATRRMSRVTIPNNVLIVTGSSSGPILADERSETEIAKLNLPQDPNLIVRTLSSAGVQARAVAIEMRRQGRSKVAVIRENAAFAESVASAFVADFTCLGGEVVEIAGEAEAGVTLYQDPPDGSSATQVDNFRLGESERVIKGIGELGVDAVYLVGQQTTAGAVLEYWSLNSNQLNIAAAQWFLGPSLLIESWAKTVPVTSGMRVSAGPKPTGRAEYDDFRARYEAATGSPQTDDPEVVAANYDATILAALAIEKVGAATDGAALRDAMFAIANGEGDTSTAVTPRTLKAGLEQLRAKKPINYAGAANESRFIVATGDGAPGYSMAVYDNKGAPVFTGDTNTPSAVTPDQLDCVR